MTNRNEESTPTLVRTFVELRIVGARRRLSDRERTILDSVVDELRRRAVLD